MSDTIKALTEAVRGASSPLLILTTPTLVLSTMPCTTANPAPSSSAWIRPRSLLAATAA
jgi:hypothetical protein